MFYNCYKNIALVLAALYYTFYCAFTGASVHERWVVSFFNFFFTGLPILSFGIFDKDITEKRALAFPELYKQGRDGTFYSFWIFIASVLNGAYHGAICFFIPLYILNITEHSDKLLVGLTIYTSLVLVVNFKMLLENG